MSYNKAYRNGINGLVVHKTDRARVIGNVLWDNGKVSKSKPESRQPYAGLTVTGAKDVQVSQNYVKTELKNDYAYMLASGSTLNSKSGNNKVKILSFHSILGIIVETFLPYLAIITFYSEKCSQRWSDGAF